MSVKKYSLGKDGEKSLSKNFKVKEFRCKDGSDEILISDEMVDLLQNIRGYFGKPVVITSAYRTKAHNTKCGGAKSSQHLLGTAADVKVEGVDPLTVARYAEMALSEKGGVGYYYNKNNFTHIDVRSKKARWKNGGTGDVSVKNHGMVEVDEIVAELEKRGIITDVALWTKRLKEDNNAYWLARKAAVLTKNKAVPTGHGEIKSIVSMLSKRGIITNVRLWNDILPEDVNLYWLAYKICNLTE